MHRDCGWWMAFEMCLLISRRILIPIGRSSWKINNKNNNNNTKCYDGNALLRYDNIKMNINDNVQLFNGSIFHVVC